MVWGKSAPLSRDLYRKTNAACRLSGPTRTPAFAHKKKRSGSRAHLRRRMGVSERVTRGILIGGALGAFSHIFGVTENLFMAVGIGAIAGCLAGLTRALVDRKRK